MLQIHMIEPCGHRLWNHWCTTICTLQTVLDGHLKGRYDELWQWMVRSTQGLSACDDTYPNATGIDASKEQSPSKRTLKSKCKEGGDGGDEEDDGGTDEDEEEGKEEEAEANDISASAASAALVRQYLGKALRDSRDGHRHRPQVQECTGTRLPTRLFLLR